MGETSLNFNSNGPSQIKKLTTLFTTSFFAQNSVKISINRDFLWKVIFWAPPAGGSGGGRPKKLGKKNHIQWIFFFKLLKKTTQCKVFSVFQFATDHLSYSQKTFKHGPCFIASYLLSAWNVVVRFLFAFLYLNIIYLWQLHRHVLCFKVNKI